MKGSMNVTLFAGGIIITIGLIVAAYYAIQSTVHGVCWADAGRSARDIVAQLDSLQTGASKNIFVSVDSSCTEAIIIGGKGGFLEAFQGLNKAVETKIACREGNVMAVAIPMYEGSAGLIDGIKEAVGQKKYTKIGQSAREFLDIKAAPICEVSACKGCGADKTLILEKGESVQKYCIEISKPLKDAFAFPRLRKVAGKEDCALQPAQSVL